MSDEIYINIGTTLQQPYQGQVPANAQSNEVKQAVRQVSVNAQTTYRSPSQTPTTYRNPVNGQLLVQDARQPSPFTYQNQQQNPFQSPFTYQQPAIYQHQNQRSSPFIDQGRQPVDAFQQPTAAYRSPVAASRQPVAAVQQPIAAVQTPIGASRQPVQVAASRQPVQVAVDQSPYISRSPYQNPFTYQNVGPIALSVQSAGLQVSRQPAIYYYQVYQSVVDPYEIEFPRPPRGMPGEVAGVMQMVGEVIRTPVINNVQGAYVNVQNPVASYPANRQSTNFYFNPYNGEDYPYQLPATYQAGSYQSPSITLVYQNPVNARQPAQQPVPVRQPQAAFTYQSPINAFTYQSPIAAYRQPTNAYRNPIAAYQSPIAASQQPVAAFTTPIGAFQQPFTFNNQQQVNDPVSASRQTTIQARGDGQASSPYIASAQQQLTIQYRSPFTYQNPVNKQVATQNIVQQPSIYQAPYQVSYQHRSPFIYKTPYSTTRSIGPIAKVKAVYVNKDGAQATPEKLEEIYVNNQNTAEKIHQTVPAARFSKHPSNTQQ
jgi:hypothetical protein